MTAWTIWLIIAALLVIVEVISQMVWTICLAIGFIAALGASLLGWGLPAQLACMAVVSVAAYLILVPYFKRLHHQATEREGARLRTGMDALIGREARVVRAIEPGRLGRVVADGDNWQERARHEGDTFSIGELVRIHSYDSIILTVERIKQQ